MAHKHHSSHAAVVDLEETRTGRNTTSEVDGPATSDDLPPCRQLSVPRTFASASRSIWWH